MKKSLELKETRSDLVSKLEGIHSGAVSEKRELNEDEGVSVDNFLGEIETLDTNIVRAEKMEAEMRNAAVVSGATVNKKDVADKRYSLQKAITGFMNHNLDGIELEYDQEARRNNTITGVGIPLMVMGEQRANPQTVANAGGFIPTEVGDWAGTLQNKTVLGDKATWMYGLSGDMKLPILSGTTAGWNGEGDAAESAATVVGSQTLQPKRLDSYMDISKMLLAQTNGSVEGIIRSDIMGAISSVLEAAVLGDNAGAGDVPQGVFDAGTAAVATGAITYASILEMQADLETANSDFGRLGYITTPAGRALLKNIVGQPTSGTNFAGQPLWYEDSIDGYEARSTGNCDTIAGANPNGIVLGRWDDCVIGQFGSALDVVVDPYTRSLHGEVRLVVLSYWDTVFRRATSFQYTYY